MHQLICSRKYVTVNIETQNKSRETKMELGTLYSLLGDFCTLRIKCHLNFSLGMYKFKHKHYANIDKTLAIQETKSTRSLRGS